MTELDSLERALDRVRAELSPTAAEAARARAAIGLSPHPSAAVGAVSSPRMPRQNMPQQNMPRSWRALRASGKAGLSTAVVLAAVSFGAGYWLGLREPGPPAELAARAPEDRARGAVRLEPPRDPPEPPRVSPAPDTASSLEPPRAPRESKPRARSTRPQLLQQPAPPAPSDELSLLRRVERALRAGEPALALALLAELDERFVDTALGEERQAANVMAHCALHDPGAELRAQRFLRDRPASVYTERVERACAESARPEGSPAAGDE